MQLNPEEPHIIAGDSANTIGYFCGINNIKSYHLQRWILTHSERAAALTYQIQAIHVHRSNNQAADRMATLAVEIIRDNSIAWNACSEDTSRYKVYRHQDMYLLLSDRDPARMSGIDWEKGEWKIALDHVTRLGIAHNDWSQDRRLRVYQWTALRIKLSHAAITAALYYKRNRSNHAPLKLLEAMQAVLNKTKGEHTMLVTWYITSDKDFRGREIEKSPGLQAVPGAFRYALVGEDHYEYDMDLAHAHIYLEFSGDMTPILRHLCDSMHDPAAKARVSSTIPGTHKIIGVILNAIDPLSPMETPMKEAHKWGRDCPHWYIALLWEIRNTRGIVKAKMHSWLQVGPHHYGGTLAGVLQAIEADVMNRFLHIVRANRGVLFTCTSA